jgi:hypothetical protein
MYILNAQVSSVSLKAGILFSDISSIGYLGELEKGNSAKRGFFLQTNAEYHLSKRRMVLDFGLNYNERKALEVFVFNLGEPGTVQNAVGTFIYSMVPTSPQSEGFYTHGRDYPHFKNFKYLHFQLIPKFVLGKKERLKMGLGMFAGLLLNRSRVIFGQKDFPWATDFEEPFNISGQNEYNDFDAGLVANVEYELPIRIKENWRIGISSSARYSFVRLNDTFPDKNYASNMRWIIAEGGIFVRYTL